MAFCVIWCPPKFLTTTPLSEIKIPGLSQFLKHNIGADFKQKSLRTESTWCRNKHYVGIMTETETPFTPLQETVQSKRF